MDRAFVYRLIDEERKWQDQKWGREPDGWTSHPLVKLAVLTEEVGEAAKACLEGKRLDAHAELVQVAAVAVAWLESFDTDGAAWEDKTG